MNWAHTFAVIQCRCTAHSLMISGGNVKFKRRTFAAFPSLLDPFLLDQWNDLTTNVNFIRTKNVHVVLSLNFIRRVSFKLKLIYGSRVWLAERWSWHRDRRHGSCEWQKNNETHGPGNSSIQIHIRFVRNGATILCDGIIFDPTASFGFCINSVA